MVGDGWVRRWMLFTADRKTEELRTLELRLTTSGVHRSGEPPVATGLGDGHARLYLDDPAVSRRRAPPV
ncbi:hypothetical protein AB0G15_31635 [Streptosporangium sp. NPDC023825]|uniref:hypothetical protein n=1 Tax=Streptosporangium sp. NPDC023825 TaxID=3154909 RepID=UPI00341C06F4